MEVDKRKLPPRNLKEYNQSRLTPQDILTGKEYRRLKRKKLL